MPLRRNTRRWAWVGAFGLLAAVIAAAAIAWTKHRDRQVASEVEAAMVETLKSLPANNPIVLRYGMFVRLEGEGFERGAHALGLPTLPIVLERRAVFSGAWARLTIIVRPGTTLRLKSLSLRPSDAEAAGLTPINRDGELRFAGWQYSCGLQVQAEHPRCPNR